MTNDKLQTAVITYTPSLCQGVVQCLDQKLLNLCPLTTHVFSSLHLIVKYRKVKNFILFLNKLNHKGHLPQCLSLHAMFAPHLSTQFHSNNIFFLKC